MSRLLTKSMQILLQSRLVVVYKVSSYHRRTSMKVGKIDMQLNGYIFTRFRETLKLIQARSFYAWLNNIFNRVDTQRIKDVGADRAGAEWLLRCGAGVKWKGKENELREYNSLPVGNFRTLMVESVDATDSAIMEAGFQHFRGMEHFHKLNLKNCCYITDESIGVLVFITKDQLDWLELSDNGNVTDTGVGYLKNLSKLKYLKLEKLPGVRNPKDLFDKLKSALPSCEIIYNDLDSVDPKSS